MRCVWSASASAVACVGGGCVAVNSSLASLREVSQGKVGLERCGVEQCPHMLHNISEHRYRDRALLSATTVVLHGD